MIIPAIRMPRAIIGKDFFILMSVRAATVSYTHLTLPTILLV